MGKIEGGKEKCPWQELALQGWGRLCCISGSPPWGPIAPEACHHKYLRPTPVQDQGPEEK